MFRAITRSKADREFQIKGAKTAVHSEWEKGKRRGYGPENWHELEGRCAWKIKK
jgi:hypothetical protein